MKYLSRFVVLPVAVIYFLAATSYAMIVISP